MKISVKTAPTDLAVTLKEAKQHLKIEDSDTSDDVVVSALIFTATDLCEAYLHSTIVRTEYSLWLDAWPSYRDVDTDAYDVKIQKPVYSAYYKPYIELPRPPVSGSSDITAFQVYDANGNASDYTGSYYVDSASVPPRLYLDASSSPPIPGRKFNGIRIDYFAGYSSNKVPQQIRWAILMVVAYLYHNRGDEAMEGDVIAKAGAKSVLDVAPNRVVLM